jgi:DHA2 family multidrug resistance protein
MGTEQVRGQLERIVEQQALTLGVNDIFLFSSIVYLVLILPVLIARPVRPRARR